MGLIAATRRRTWNKGPADFKQKNCTKTRVMLSTYKRIKMQMSVACVSNVEDGLQMSEVSTFCLSDCIADLLTWFYRNPLRALLCETIFREGTEILILLSGVPHSFYFPYIPLKFAF